MTKEQQDFIIAENEKLNSELIEFKSDVRLVISSISALLDEFDLPPGVFDGTVPMASILPGLITKFAGGFDETKVDFSSLKTLIDKYKHLADEGK